ncbi:hypothetical protein K2Q16_01510 [Patescibacteria group bacterium]|nr:hypothetical protein [Patescibacteria group bacterium]
MHWNRRLTEILPLALSEDWDIRRDGVPKVRANLRLAISSLNKQQPNFWENHELAAKLVKAPRNAGVRTILAQYSNTEIAFAIRDARFASDDGRT